MVALHAQAATVTLNWDFHPESQKVIRYGIYERVGNGFTYFGFVTDNQAVLLNVPIGSHCFTITALNGKGESRFSKEACTDILTAGTTDGPIELEGGQGGNNGNGNGNSLPSVLPPGGDYLVDLEEDTRLWDLSGFYDEVIYDDGTNRLVAAYVLEADSMGRLDGTGTFDLSIADPVQPINVDGIVTIRGRMSSSRNVVRTSYRLAFDGAGLVQNSPMTFKSSLNVRSEMDESLTQMIGSVRGSLRIRIDGQRPITRGIRGAEFDTPVPTPADGQWTFRLQNISASGPQLNRLSGAASIDLSNGREFTLDTVRGNFNKRRNTSTISARGSRTNFLSRGVSMSLWAEEGGDLMVDRVMIRVLGQRIRLLNLNDPDTP